MDLSVTYQEIIEDIKKSEDIFSQIGNSGSLEKIYEEMVFCILTPQSKARMAEKVIYTLKKSDLLLNPDLDNDIFVDMFKHVRFYRTKAQNVVRLHKQVFEEKYPILSIIETDPIDARELLVKDIKGWGYKESSHFLRNIGKGDKIAILDRHILKNLVKYNVIDEVPATITSKKYLEIEEKMRNFALDIQIPFSHLDFIFWYRETQDIFK